MARDRTHPVSSTGGPPSPARLEPERRWYPGVLLPPFRRSCAGGLAVAGPGVELLEYRAPRDGRPYPEGTHPNDLFYWQTTVRTATPDAMLQALCTDSRASGALATLPGSEGVAQTAALVRDPDGHALRVIAP
jgi:hypothetical protein